MYFRFLYYIQPPISPAARLLSAWRLWRSTASHRLAAFDRPRHQDVVAPVHSSAPRRRFLASAAKEAFLRAGSAFFLVVAGQYLRTGDCRRYGGDCLAGTASAGDVATGCGNIANLQHGDAVATAQSQSSAFTIPTPGADYIASIAWWRWEQHQRRRKQRPVL